MKISSYAGCIYTASYTCIESSTPKTQVPLPIYRTQLLRTAVRVVQTHSQTLQLQKHHPFALQKSTLHLQRINHHRVRSYPHLCLPQSARPSNHQSLSHINARLWPKEESQSGLRVLFHLAIHHPSILSTYFRRALETAFYRTGNQSRKHSF